MEDALNPDKVGSRLQALGTSTIANGEKRELIDNYLLLYRSSEEIKLLREEAQNIVAYYKNRKVVVEEEIAKLSAADLSPVNKGAVALYHKFLSKVNTLLVQGMDVLKAMDARDNEREEIFESVLDDDLDSDESSDESSDEDLQ